jgi:hypothetical protein
MKPGPKVKETCSKGHTMTENEFKAWVVRVHNHLCL